MLDRINWCIMIWATILIYETFSRWRFIKNGYSKDGKFKEDQIVIAWQLITNDTLHYKIFPGNVTDSNTFIPFMLEIADYLWS